tara:strand:- start:113 stop:322 length:210 start_codon:yes stop_codon:yes gene_type:complete
LISIGYEVLGVGGSLLSFSIFSAALSSCVSERASIFSANIRLLATDVIARTVAEQIQAPKRLADKVLLT